MSWQPIDKFIQGSTVLGVEADFKFPLELNTFSRNNNWMFGRKDEEGSNSRSNKYGVIIKQFSKSIKYLSQDKSYFCCFSTLLLPFFVHIFGGNNLMDDNEHEKNLLSRSYGKRGWDFVKKRRFVKFCQNTALLQFYPMWVDNWFLRSKRILFRLVWSGTVKRKL